MHFFLKPFKGFEFSGQVIEHATDSLYVAAEVVFLPRDVYVAVFILFMKIASVFLV